MTEFDITVKFRVKSDQLPVAEDVERDLLYLFRNPLSRYDTPSEIEVLSILHTDAEFLNAMSYNAWTDDLLLPPPHGLRQ